MVVNKVRDFQILCQQFKIHKKWKMKNPESL